LPQPPSADKARLHRIQFLRQVEVGIHAASPRRMRRGMLRRQRSNPSELVAPIGDRRGWKRPRGARPHPGSQQDRREVARDCSHRQLSTESSCHLVFSLQPRCRGTGGHKRTIRAKTSPLHEVESQGNDQQAHEQQDQKQPDDRSDGRRAPL